MEGRARAPGAGTVLNALATRRGSAFAIDRHTTATVELSTGEEVVAEVADDPTADTTLIETCVRETVGRYGDGRASGGHVETESDLPMASGLKSSSAAANATVLATLAALDRASGVDRADATRIGVAAAREAGVTVTGAFDDASASMLGGVTITNNETDELLSRESFDRHVAIHTPPERAYSADADLAGCRRIAPVAETVEELARDGRYGRAMTVNGFAYAAALGFPPDRMLEALPDVDGVSLSGTGPSTVAIGTAEEVAAVADRWREAPGTVRTTTTTNTGAEIL